MSDREREREGVWGSFQHASTALTHRRMTTHGTTHKTPHPSAYLANRRVFAEFLGDSHWDTVQLVGQQVTKGDAGSERQ